MADVLRAAVITAPREVRIETLPLPAPREGELLVEVEGCGVCHSNLPAWEGRPWFRYPLPPGNPGHEGWGRVVGTRERVAFLSSNAYASHAVVRASECVKLPDDGIPFPAEPIGCAVNIFRRSRIEAGQSVAIIGIGFLGALLTQFCAEKGAQVIAIARRPFSQELARRHGARVVVPMDDHARIIERVRDLTHGAFCDVVIEAVGEQWPLDLAGELTRERGTLVIAGYHQDARQVNMQLWNWRGLDVVNAHERDPRVYVEGMRIAAASGIDPRPLLTEFPLEKLSDAFRATQERPEGFVKGWVKP